MEEFKIKSNKSGVETELHEIVFQKILQVTYLRNRELFKCLVPIYEQLKQETFDLRIVDLKLTRKTKK